KNSGSLESRPDVLRVGMMVFTLLLISNCGRDENPAPAVFHAIFVTLVHAFVLGRRDDCLHNRLAIAAGVLHTYPRDRPNLMMRREDGELVVVGSAQRQVVNGAGIHPVGAAEGFKIGATLVQ